MTMEQLQTTAKNTTQLSLVEIASHDQRVARLAEHFSRGDFRFDPIEVELIANDYGISAYDVTEGACLQNLVRRVDEAADGEA